MKDRRLWSRALEKGIEVRVEKEIKFEIQIIENLTELLRFISLNNVPNTTQSPRSLSLPSLSIIRDKIGTEGPHFRADKMLTKDA